MSDLSLATVFSVAKSTGAATTKCVELLKGHVAWDDAASVKAIANEFKLGRIASYLSLKTRDEACVVADKPGWVADSKAPDLRRTEREQRAYRAAVSGWEHIARLAGMPARSNGTQRPKAQEAATHAAPQAKNAPMSPAAIVAGLPKATKAEDATAMAVRFAHTLLAYSNANAKAMPGELKALFHKFGQDVTRIAEGRAPELKPAKAA